MSMVCSDCGSEAPEGARFCPGCGASLIRACLDCGAEIPPDARFCSACGHRVGADEAPAAEAAPAASEQRKLITVLFADLVGFTSHTERSDPEDVRERLSTYHQRVREDVERFGGRVEKLMGDGVFAVFGVPTAHEDDPERAVRAALRIQESVSVLNGRQPELELSVRIGVTTGEAIVQLDSSAPDREGIIGDVVNTASRLEGVAAPGTVVVDERTYRGSVASIEFEDGESVTVKGKADPIRIWRAVSSRSRLGATIEDAHTTPFLGREAELDVLVSTFDRTVRENTVQLVSIIGEPGVGKSRLLHEFRLVVDDRPELVWWRQGRCLSYGEGITFWALGEIVKAQAGILDSDDTVTAGAKLRRAVDALFDDEATARWVEGRLELVAGVVGADDASGQELFAALTRFFEALAAINPLILVIEDLQWADPSLLEFLDHLTSWSTESPILVAATARPEFLTSHPEWGGGKRNASTIGLSRLSDDDTARIIGSLLDRTLLDAGLQRALLDRCGGNPLYATEFVRYAMERGLLDRAAGSELDVPDTIHGLIAARLDLLDPEERLVLQAASVVGRVFWSGVLSRATGLSPEVLGRRLRALATRELIRPVREPSMVGQQEWMFAHALIGDVVYGQIPRGDRGRLHLTVTRWIEEVAADRSGEVAELLAHHYGRVFDLAPASVDDEIGARAYQVVMAAAERVRGLDAARGARYFERAVEWAPTAVDRARARLERAHRFLDYDSVDQAEEDGRIAYEEAKESGDVELQAHALFVLSGNRWYRGDAEGRRAALEEAAALLDGRPPSETAVRVILARAFDAWVAGESALALDIIDQGRAAVTEVGSPTALARLIGTEGGARVALGDATGLDMMQMSLDTHLDSNATDLANSEYNNLATAAVFFWPAAQVAALMDQAIAMCEERGYAPHAEWSRMTRVESLFPLGRWDEARRDLEDVVASDIARGGSRVTSDAQGWLALFALHGGDAQRARTLFEEAAEVSGDFSAGDVQYRAGAETVGLLIGAALADDAMIAEYADRLEASLTPQGEFADFYSGMVASVLAANGRLDQLRRLVAVSQPRGLWGKARLLLSRAVIAAAEGDHAVAIDLAEQAIVITEDLGHVFDPMLCRLTVARSLQALDRSAEAADVLERVIEEATSIGAVRVADEAQALLDGRDDARAARS